jgi:hypothetical protein
VGPLMTTVGLLVPELWHIVQVEPLLPGAPEIPFGYARADDDRQITAINIRAAMQRRFNVFSGMIFSSTTGAGDSSALCFVGSIMFLRFELTRRHTPNRN